jgi:uncharacterized protein (PEP-CTERM system associated)
MRRRLIIGAIGASVAGTASAAQWTITPSLGFQELLTDNLGATETHKQGDAISQLTPGLDVSAQGARTNLNLSYRPILSAYIATPGQDRIDQNLIGEGTFTPFENRLDINAQIYANENSGNGNYITPAASGLVPRNQRVLDYGGTITPHYQERFGDIATLDAYYRVNSTNSSAQYGGSNSNTRGLSNSQLSREGNLIFGSGDSFGQLVTRINLDHEDASGSGINTAWHSDRDVLEADYHINFKYTVSAWAGYQATRYDSTEALLGYHQSGLTWNVAFRGAPNDTTNYTIGYGRQQGSYNANAQINYGLAPRTTVTAYYTVQVENNLQTVSANFPFLTFNALGQPIDIRTGLPYNPANQPFGQQNNLFRDKHAEVTISHQFIRSTLALEVYNDSRDQLGGAIGNNAVTGVVGSGGTQSSTGVTLLYTREITPVVTGRADVGYVTNQFSNTGFQATGQHDQYLNFDAGLTFNINATLSANMTYSHFRRISTFENNSVVINELAIGITKSF